LDPLDAERQNRVDQLLRDAHLQRMRRQWAAAEILCREALELSPDDPLGTEMLADLLVEKGSTEEALDLYRRALERQPGKAALEEKIARLALRKGQEEQERLAALAAMDQPGSQAERKRNALIGLLLSLVCPGAGQFFFGQRIKGAILFAVGALCLALGLRDLVLFVLAMAGLLGRAQPRPNEVLAWIGIIGAAVWFYSLLDASARAGRIEKGA
jgi:tetratricopeptide (TPR) repeat protein